MARYAKGDYVVHQGQGVCEVAGIARREVDGTAFWEYELYPITGTRMRICFPVSNEDRLRPPVGRREALELIEQMPLLDEDAFTDSRSWAVEEHFANGLRHGDCRDALRTVKTIHHRMDDVRARGKGPRACYDRLYRMACERAYSELGLALNKTPAEVEDLVSASFRRAGA
jgi:CarD family transcriptional regulator